MLSVESLWKCSGLLVLLAIAGGAPAASGAAEAPAATATRAQRPDRSGRRRSLRPRAARNGRLRAPPHQDPRLRRDRARPASRIVNLKDVAAPNGIAAIELGQLARAAAVDVEAHVREASPPRTAVHRGEATVKLRPDLSVAAVHAPPQTLTTRAIDVVADLSELNGETGATVTVKLMLGPTPVAEPQTITMPAGGGRSVTFRNVKLTTAMSADLTVVLDGAEPAETDGTNNSRGATVEVTEHELVRSSVLVEALGGYGAQFNQHVYAPITNAPPASLPDLEAKVEGARAPARPDLLQRQLGGAAPDRGAEHGVVHPRRFSSRTRRARRSTSPTRRPSVARLNPVPSMTRFAAVLEDLVETAGLTNVRWVTVQNEPNTPGAALTLEQYNALYRALHAQLVARGLREHVKLMGGDLIESSGARFHTIWWEYIGAQHERHPRRLLGAHLLELLGHPVGMEFRLKDVHRIVTQEIAPRGPASRPT